MTAITLTRTTSTTTADPSIGAQSCTLAASTAKDGARVGANAYGYFDETAREYVITRPDTPTPWLNYIGEGRYGGIVSNTGGGYSFDRDPRNRRVTRYRYNSIPVDQPGRYVYLRDQETGEYWSPTAAPVKREASARIRFPAALSCAQVASAWRHSRRQPRICVHRGIEFSVIFQAPTGILSGLSGAMWRNRRVGHVDGSAERHPQAGSQLLAGKGGITANPSL